MDELALFLAMDTSQINASLSALIVQKIVFQQDDYYALKPTVNILVAQRLDKEAQAKSYLKKLPFYAKLIRAFPFVSAIGISGSLSKNVMHDDGDVDYFIITKPGRLWVCRTFLVGFKKVFLFNSKKYFCVNYFVDEDNLMIPDHNIFTAIEISFLLPVYNTKLINQFRKTNEWSGAFLHSFNHPVSVKEVKGKSWLGRLIEFCLKGKLGDRLDLRLMQYTYKRWEKKFENFDAKKFELTMRTNRGVSKHHPRDFQNKVLKAYQERLLALNIDE